MNKGIRTMDVDRSTIKNKINVFMEFLQWVTMFVGLAAFVAIVAGMLGVLFLIAKYCFLAFAGLI